MTGNKCPESSSKEQRSENKSLGNIRSGNKRDAPGVKFVGFCLRGVMNSMFFHDDNCNLRVELNSPMTSFTLLFTSVVRTFIFQGLVIQIAISAKAFFVKFFAF